MKKLLKAAAALCVLLLLSGAVYAGELTIYYGIGREHFDPILDIFEETTGIKTNRFRAPTEEMLTTVEMELRAGRPKADVIVAAAPQIMALQTRYEAFQEYEPKDAEMIIDEVRYIHPALVPIGMQLYVINYNTNRVSEEDVPKTWLDFIDDKFMNQLAMADPRSSASVHGIIWYIADYMYEKHGEPYGWGYFEKLGKLNIRLTSGHGPIMDLVETGERPVAIQLLSSTVGGIKRGEPTWFVFPEDGSPVETQMIGILEQAQNTPEAQAFIDFLVSPYGQELIRDLGNMMPIRPDVEYEFPDGTTLADHTIVAVDAEYLTYDKRIEYMEKFHELMQ